MIGNNKKLGFTLVEVLISLTLFSVFVLVMIKMFVALNSTSKKDLAYNNLIKESNSIMESIIELVRQGEIDYLYQKEVASCGTRYDNSCLIIKNSNNRLKLSFLQNYSFNFYNNLGCSSNTYDYCLAFCDPYYGRDCKALNSNNIRVAMFSIYVWPNTGYSYNENTLNHHSLKQSLVTIQAVFQSQEDKKLFYPVQVSLSGRNNLNL